MRQRMGPTAPAEGNGRQTANCAGRSGRRCGSCSFPQEDHGGLQTAIQGICELRNTQGFASHGKDAYTLQLDIVQAQLAARAADAIVNFLFRAHRHYPIDGPARRLVYRELANFNDWIDEQNGIVRIFMLEYKPSEVLFGIDQEAYRDLLADYEAEDETEDQPGETEQEGGEAE